MDKILDMPKLQSPFVREAVGRRYLVTDKISEGYEWVLTEPGVLAVDKIDGTNVAVLIENGNIKRFFNRTTMELQLLSTT